jgi:hypothetical protein
MNINGQSYGLTPAPSDPGVGNTPSGWNDTNNPYNNNSTSNQPSFWNPNQEQFDNDEPPAFDAVVMSWGCGTQLTPNWGFTIPALTDQKQIPPQYIPSDWWSKNNSYY